MKRPTGVTILAVLAFIGGALGLCGGVLGLTAAGLVGTAAVATSSTASTVSTGELLGLGIVALVLGALDIVLGVGLLQLKPWAWTLGLGLEAVNILVSIVYIATGASNIASQAIGVIIAIAVIAYLFQPQVKQAFGRA